MAEMCCQSLASPCMPLWQVAVQSDIQIELNHELQKIVLPDMRLLQETVKKVQESGRHALKAQGLHTSRVSTISEHNDGHPRASLPGVLLLQETGETVQEGGRCALKAQGLCGLLYQCCVPTEKPVDQRMRVSVPVNHCISACVSKYACPVSPQSSLWISGYVYQCLCLRKSVSCVPTEQPDQCMNTLVLCFATEQLEGAHKGEIGKH
eukprot:1159778-Pelagomonas_calceolata.AAC.20